MSTYKSLIEAKVSADKVTSICRSVIKEQGWKVLSDNGYLITIKGNSTSYNNSVTIRIEINGTGLISTISFNGECFGIGPIYNSNLRRNIENIMDGINYKLLNDAGDIFNESFKLRTAENIIKQIKAKSEDVKMLFEKENRDESENTTLKSIILDGIERANKLLEFGESLKQKYLSYKYDKLEIFNENSYIELSEEIRNKIKNDLENKIYPEELRECYFISPRGIILEANFYLYIFKRDLSSLEELEEKEIGLMKECIIHIDNCIHIASTAEDGDYKIPTFLLLKFLIFKDLEYLHKRYLKDESINTQPQNTENPEELLFIITQKYPNSPEAITACELSMDYGIDLDKLKKEMIKSHEELKAKKEQEEFENKIIDTIKSFPDDKKAIKVLMKYYHFNENDAKAWVNYVRPKMVQSNNNEVINNRSTTSTETNSENIHESIGSNSIDSTTDEQKSNKDADIEFENKVLHALNYYKDVKKTIKYLKNTTNIKEQDAKQWIDSVSQKHNLKF